MIERRCRVRCDGCGTGPSTLHADVVRARAAVKKLGWLRVPKRPGIHGSPGADYCPTCKRERAQSEAVGA